MIEELNNASQSLAWLPYAIALIPCIIAIIPSFFSFFFGVLIMLCIGIPLMFGISFWLFGSFEQFTFYLSVSDKEDLFLMYILFFFVFILFRI